MKAAATFLGFALLLPSGFAESPDAPSHWYQKRYEPQSVSWSTVFKDPLIYTNVGVDLGLSLTDTSLSEQCYTEGYVEGTPPARPAHSNLYRDNAIEAVAVFGVTVLYRKVKGPRWVLPLFLTAPAIIHGHGIHSGVNCHP